MTLAEFPVVLMLVGLAAYAVLAGADFGAGFWQLLGGRGDRDRRLREHAHHAVGPVWEANHVWLIFVLVVCWTAYPKAFGSITSTLAVPLFIAGVGIVMRGTAYALRSGASAGREERAIELVFALSSILTPFALGSMIGSIASGRVPVGNAEGDLATSWLNETSILIGGLAVATAAYLAAVYLAADAARLGDRELEHAFRVRALVTAVLAGAAALGGLAVVHEDARPIWDGLTGGSGLAAVIVSGLAGVATVALVLRRRYEPARVSAALAVAAIIAGWGLAQRPDFLPGLTIEEAAAGRSTLVAMLVALGIGAFVLLPSLGWLFALVLRGRLDETAELVESEPTARAAVRDRQPLLAAAGTCFVIGTALAVILETPWGRIVGIPLLLTAIALGFVALASAIAGAQAEEAPARDVDRRDVPPDAGDLR
jgi:cytochrome d ubiquinol oxidase subunit II